MFRHYFVVSLRSFLNNRHLSIINALGLAVGMAFCILSILFTVEEFSYEQHHKNADQIFRVIRKQGIEGSLNELATTPYLLASTLREEFPEVLTVTRLCIPSTGFSGSSSLLVKSSDKQFFENRIVFADPQILEVFNFEILHGDHQTALKAPNSILISQHIVKKYFGEQNPIGKTLTMMVHFRKTQDFKITGIFKDYPNNTHLKFDIIASLSSYIQTQAHVSKFMANSFFINRIPSYTYFHLKDGYSIDVVERRLDSISKSLREKLQYVSQENFRYNLDIQALTQIHFFSHLEEEIEPAGDITSVYLLVGISGLILFIACVNFINITTARFSSRANEIGVRKVFGADRFSLIKQFLGETLLLSFFSLLLALGSVELALPYINAFLGKEMGFNIDNIGLLFVFFSGLWFLVAILAGSLPAFFLASLQPVQALNKAIKSGTKSIFFKRLLVGFQFTVSVALIICTIVIFNQQNYIQNKNLGFNKEQIVTFPVQGLLNSHKRGPKDVDTLNRFRHELLKYPSIQSVTASSSVPGKEHIEFRVSALDEEKLWLAIAVDYDFLETYEVELITGRNFSKNFETDKRRVFLLNEKAVETLRLNSLTSQSLPEKFGPIPTKNPTVIGIIKDFHTDTLHENIIPLAIFLDPTFCQYISVRINPNNISTTLEYIESVWQKFSPGYPLHYTFLRDDIDRLYRSEKKLAQVFTFFAFWAIFVSCLGVFSLSSFEIERRLKEIGIRKILGASVTQVIFLLSKEFISLSIISNLIAWPLAFYFMNQWLQEFAYRIDISFDVFIFSAALSLGVTLTTLFLRIHRVAQENPIQALRYE